MTETRTPLFPLDLVLLPEERIPLHIFELRYQTMVRRCLEEKIPFAVVYVVQSRLAEVACLAHVEKVLRRFEDGRSHILVRGGARVRLGEPRQHAGGYLEAGWSEVSDREGGPDPGARRTLEGLFAEFAGLRDDLPDEAASPAEEEPLVEGEASSFTFLVGARCRLGPKARQTLLQSTSETEREMMLIEHLVRAIPRLRQRRADLERVRTNGRVHRAP